MKVVHDALTLGVCEECIKSVFKLPRGLGNLLQVAELAGNGRHVGGSLAEIHGGKSRGVVR